MKRYLTIAKQVAKERIGSKDENINSDEVEVEREHFVTLKEGYTKIHSNAKSYYNEYWPSFLSHNEALIAQFLAFSEALKGSNLSSPTTTTVAESLEYVGNGLQRENKIAGYCVQSDKSGFLETTHKICDIFIKDVNELRLNQELARLQLSSTLGQLKSMQKKASVISSKDAVSVTTKLQQAEEENRQAQEEYNTATSLFIEGMGRLETAGRKEFISSLTSLAEAHLRSMEDGVAMWKDVLANLEKLDERDVIRNATPPTTPIPLPKSVPTQLSTPTLQPKSNPGTPKPFSSTTSSSTTTSPPDTPPPTITLDSTAIDAIDPFDDQAPSVSLSGGDPILRRNSSPKPLLPNPDSPNIPISNTFLQNHTGTLSNHLNKDDIETSSNFEGSSDQMKDQEQEEYEELAL